MRNSQFVSNHLHAKEPIPSHIFCVRYFIMTTTGNTRPPPSNARASLATCVTEEKLLHMYTSAKGWKTRKLETTRCRDLGSLGVSTHPQDGETLLFIYLSKKKNLQHH